MDVVSSMVMCPALLLQAQHLPLLPLRRLRRRRNPARLSHPQPRSQPQLLLRSQAPRPPAPLPRRLQPVLSLATANVEGKIIVDQPFVFLGSSVSTATLVCIFLISILKQIRRADSNFTQFIHNVFLLEEFGVHVRSQLKI